MRSLVFVAWLYLSLAVFAVGMSPALILPHRYALGVVKAWARFVLLGLDWVAGIKVRFEGLEHRPEGRALLACKHQGMLDIIIPFVVLDDPCIITKKELMILPFFGWFAWKTKMISVDRSAASKALRDMVKQARVRISEGRQIWIFPEGTRAPVGSVPDYKPGVAALYRDIGSPCWPVATNAGVHWPAHGFRRYPGVVIYQFLPPIEAGLKRPAFMAELEVRIETASRALL